MPRNGGILLFVAAAAAACMAMALANPLACSTRVTAHKCNNANTSLLYCLQRKMTLLEMCLYGCNAAAESPACNASPSHASSSSTTLSAKCRPENRAACASVLFNSTDPAIQDPSMYHADGLYKCTLKQWRLIDVCPNGCETYKKHFNAAVGQCRKEPRSGADADADADAGVA